MHKSILYSGLAVAGLVFAAPATAADNFEGEPIVVTASRSEQADAGLARSSVISREQIEHSQAPDLLELLRLEAGLDVACGGGPGSQTSVFMRGSNSNHMLVLIDGVRAAAAGTGAFTWESMDPAIVERIEIVRGPQAARWGSDAIGGVIQIFTRTPDGAHVRGAWGRYRDRSVSAAVGSAPFSLGASVRTVEGFSAQNERGFSYDPDNDGFENASLTMGGEYSLAAGELSWSMRGNDGQVEFDQGAADILSWSAVTTYKHNRGENWRWQASAGLLRDRLDTEAPFGESSTQTRRTQASIQAERGIGMYSQWLLGMDSWRESGYSSDNWSGDRYNIGAWTGLEGRSQAFDWEASLRGDRDEHFGSAVTGNLAAGWRPADDWRLFARLGKAFRAPDFNQLYAQGFGGLYAGNPELDPESSRSGEIGADWNFTGRQTLGLSLYETRISDLIDFAGPDMRAVNVERARIQGAELTYRHSMQRWHAQAALTWQDPENRDTGEQLLRRAKNKASAALDYRFDDGGWAGIELSHTGRRPDAGGMDLTSITLVNLRAGKPLGNGFRIEGRLENATDRNYDPLYGFNAARRSLFVALSWQG